ncbi:hypothetical protein COV22_00725, partial [Candidatus Woesearchaeota archaeon CG10_big_fil_rev_8_21_14_0_10_47_5]
IRKEIRKGAEEHSSSCFYISIAEPNDVRRNILETARIVIRSLKNYGEINRIQSRKAEAVSEAKNKMSEVSHLFLKVKEMVPQAELQRLERPQTPPAQGLTQGLKGGVQNPILLPEGALQKPAAYKGEAAGRPKKPDQKLDRLEAELGEIEKKLQRMV